MFDVVGVGSWEYVYSDDCYLFSDGLLVLFGWMLVDVLCILDEWLVWVYLEDVVGFIVVVDVIKLGKIVSYLLEYCFWYSIGYWFWVEDCGCIIECVLDGVVVVMVGVLFDILVCCVEWVSIEFEYSCLSVVL